MTALMSLDDHTDALAANLPSGRVWIPKRIAGSNLRSFLRGVSASYRFLDERIQRIIDQQIPTTTTDYLDEWESALSLPDPCLPIAQTEDERRRTIEIKLAILAGMSTKADFEYLATLFGLSVEVNPAIDHVSVADGGYGVKTPVLDIPADLASVAVARSTICVVEVLPEAVGFEYEFPLPFATTTQLQLRCLFDRLKPANTQIVYRTAV